MKSSNEDNVDTEIVQDVFQEYLVNRMGGLRKGMCRANLISFKKKDGKYLLKQICNSWGSDIRFDA